MHISVHHPPFPARSLLYRVRRLNGDVPHTVPRPRGADGEWEEHTGQQEAAFPPFPALPWLSPTITDSAARCCALKDVLARQPFPGARDPQAFPQPGGTALPAGTTVLTYLGYYCSISALNTADSQRSFWSLYLLKHACRMGNLWGALWVQDVWPFFLTMTVTKLAGWDQCTGIHLVINDYCIGWNLHILEQC